MKINISNRLIAVASMVTPGYVVTDIGTDHGYVPIYLIENNIANRVIAMDVNKGPLERAKDNIKKNAFENKIETRLSDGFAAMQKGEADIAVIAGMGGELMVNIMEKGRDVVLGLKEMVVSPHSEIDVVRRYLHKIGFKIEEEKIIKDEGKFYTIIRCVKGEDKVYTELEYKYGAKLLEEKNEVLIEFLNDKIKKFSAIKDNLIVQNSEKGNVRIEEINKELQEIETYLRK